MRLIAENDFVATVAPVRVGPSQLENAVKELADATQPKVARVRKAGYKEPDYEEPMRFFPVGAES